MKLLQYTALILPLLYFHLKQASSRGICHRKCEGISCRETGEENCCHLDCICGCTGPAETDCIECVFDDDGNLSCPSRYIYYLPTVRRRGRNRPPQGFCFDKCPRNMLVEENECVMTCGEGRHDNGEGLCLPCEGDDCNRDCYGIGSSGGGIPLRTSRSVDANNIGLFEDCNIIRGNLIFGETAFTEDSEASITAAQLVTIFSSVKVITGYLKIASWSVELEDFSVFSSLTTINGYELLRGVAGLFISDNPRKRGPSRMKNVRSLGFRSLRSIDNGNVYIAYTRSMCYQDKVTWADILQNPIDHADYINGVELKGNRAHCEDEECNAACQGGGCWGPEPNDCEEECTGVLHEGQCLPDCPMEDNVYREGNTCMPCDEQCSSTCHGAGPTNCTACIRFKDGDTCVASCPDDKTFDHASGQCRDCPTCASARLLTLDLDDDPVNRTGSRPRRRKLDK